MSRENSSNAIARAEEDVRRGDLWLAKLRLASYLTAAGYDGDVLNRLGRICHDMHDDFQAGKYWLLCDVDGPEVDRAIETFLKTFNEHPHHKLSALPRQVRVSLDRYPPRVRARLERLGLAEVVEYAPRPAPDGAMTGKEKIVAGLICVLGVVFAVASITGIGQWAVWLFGE